MNKPLVVMLGGSGFVGRHLAPRLVAAGYRVRVPSRNRNMARDVGCVPGVELVNCNVHDPAELRRVLEGASVAINLVGILNESGHGGAGFNRAHVELTRNLIGACKEAGVGRLLQMSALNAGRGTSHYLRTRGEAEQLVRQSGLAYTIFQPSVIFGRGDGLFGRFALLLRFAPVLPLARASARFAPVYVGDVADAFLAAMSRKDTVGQVIELYGDEVLTLKQIVEYTARCMGLKRLIVPLPDALARIQALVFDFVPGKPFSSDNYRSLKLDSVGGVDGLHRLGIAKTPIDAVVPKLLGEAGRQTLLDRNRRVR
ncbi:complex I NDUFA9 subunit family protein [Pseudomarimonas salicorniae]|uniref:Complex I NDUFA9 subunit family protein n=1 Tax=Pseudomarimonas salicorniae TaxID=2933270 RepID=A0ABT0GFR5_9GAMM|nr:complex I NDUFA9 subunit family protein [Lysobacter sp. CAU 1642]MCK7593380.1 complex I NDUFA9 subunit family protein [Lysobacter sp. CAU 1642]